MILTAQLERIPVLMDDSMMLPHPFYLGNAGDNRRDQLFDKRIQSDNQLLRTINVKYKKSDPRSCRRDKIVIKLDRPRNKT